MRRFVGFLFVFVPCVVCRCVFCGRAGVFLVVMWGLVGKVFVVQSFIGGVFVMWRFVGGVL